MYPQPAMVRGKTNKSESSPKPVIWFQQSLIRVIVGFFCTLHGVISIIAHFRIKILGSV
jgi:hypothetical protein